MAAPRAGEDFVCVSEEAQVEATMAEWAALFWAVGIGYSTVMSIRLYDNLTVKSRARKGMNDDEMVDGLFERLLRAAQREFIIHDDGDAADKSVYNDDAVMAALRDRMRENKRLRTRIYFNYRRDLKVNAVAREFGDRLEIRYNPGVRPKRDVHYKIIDGGVQGHLSLHDPGSGDRKFEFFDCSRASGWMRRKLFGDHRENFERDFAVADLA